jgi:SNF2 family DNA or RNA helicase
MELKPTWPEAKYAEHQEFGIRWMLNQENNGREIDGKIVRGGILGDEMGLGKTIQSLALIVNSPKQNTLILTPLAVRKQWEEAAARCNLNIFTAEKGCWELHGKQRLRKSVFIGHYDKLVSDSDLFNDMNFDRIILDEAHRIRNMKTVTAIKIFKIKAVHCWALTATPIVNKLDDAVAYLKFIGCPVKDSASWQSEYEGWIQKTYLARTLDQCEAPAGLTMPPEPIVETRYLEMSDDTEKELYEGILGNIESKWREAQRLNGQAYMLAYLSILLRLRQVSVHPGIYIKARDQEAFGWSGPTFNQMSRKFDEIQSLLRDGYESKNSHRWIIFCQFKEEIVMLKEFLKAFRFIGSVLEYHGGMTLAEREEAIQQSKIVSSDHLQDVFLIQLQAGGTGLNLQHYDRIIFISPWWTAALLNQAVGRAVRIGQKEVVKIYWLKLKEEGRFNIDSFISDKADEKRDLALMFLGWSVGKYQDISREEI